MCNESIYIILCTQTNLNHPQLDWIWHISAYSFIRMGTKSFCDHSLFDWQVCRVLIKHLRMYSRSQDFYRHIGWNQKSPSASIKCKKFWKSTSQANWRITSSALWSQPHWPKEWVGYSGIASRKSSMIGIFWS